MSDVLFPQYNADYISGCMSLRKPQQVSLKRLETILNEVRPCKNLNLKRALTIVHNLYPTCTNFERDFMSITFALATGVGKTRLMGAFITFLYTQYGIRNFFVVAPGLTVYEKLKNDLGNPANPKYVFKGIGCFSKAPQVIADDDYKQKQLSFYQSDIRIFVFNIAKFNAEDVNMRRINEYLGRSFYDYLASLEDLVMIMDESHHYRAENGAKALNDLHPILGLELTATPLVNQGGKQIPFQNVVYEYPLSKAIEDGYTRTPFAVTRTNIDFYNFGDEQLDKLMLQDGIACHENAKRKLRIYAENHDKKPVVKPFMLVVCKDTNHAEWVKKYIQSDEFRDGQYKNKVIMVHSNQRGAEKDENIKLLLEVERSDNPVEIVIHVNMLKEGWDVNNLYTIVPLRTAASKILREQMVGRGLRLPYGKRTGDKDVDSVMLTAHDKFKEILEEAQKGDSIFKAGNVIKAEDIPKEETSYTQLAFESDDDAMLKEAYRQTKIKRTEKTDAFMKSTYDKTRQKVVHAIQTEPSHNLSNIQKEKIVHEVQSEVRSDDDLGDIYHDNEMPLTAWIRNQTDDIYKTAVNHFIPIPQIKVTDEGTEDYHFFDFDMDLSDFKHVPIKNELLIQNLEDPSDLQRVKGDSIDFEGYNPKRVIVELLREKPEIDYEKCSNLLFKLISQVCGHYESLYGENGLKNIVMMYRKDISNRIYNQMMQHFYCTNGMIKEEVIGTKNYNSMQLYGYTSICGLYENYNGSIRSVLFTGIKKGVFSSAKFDSDPELQLARIMEHDDDVQNWLRPAPCEFDITYNYGHRYEPDFVVELKDCIYLVEVKGEDKLNAPDVLAKKDRGIQYCKVASNWGKANGYKEWRYLFIPSKQVQPSVSFKNLVERFKEL